jgi:hypothetical protein
MFMPKPAPVRSCSMAAARAVVRISAGVRPSSRGPSDPISMNSGASRSAGHP